MKVQRCEFLVDGSEVLVAAVVYLDVPLLQFYYLCPAGVNF